MITEYLCSLTSPIMHGLSKRPAIWMIGPTNNDVDIVKAYAADLWWEKWIKNN